jgi:hypothetical protein
MRRFLPGVINFLMTGFADLRSHILGGFGRRRCGRRCAGGLGVLTSSLLARLAGGISARNEKTKHPEQKNSTGLVIKFVAHKFCVPQLHLITQGKTPPSHQFDVLEIAEILM